MVYNSECVYSINLIRQTRPVATEHGCPKKEKRRICCQSPPNFQQKKVCFLLSMSWKTSLPAPQVLTITALLIFVATVSNHIAALLSWSRGADVSQGNWSVATMSIENYHIWHVDRDIPYPQVTLYGIFWLVNQLDPHTQHNIVYTTHWTLNFSFFNFLIWEYILCDGAYGK